VTTDHTSVYTIRANIEDKNLSEARNHNTVNYDAK